MEPEILEALVGISNALKGIVIGLLAITLALVNISTTLSKKD